MAVNLFNNGDKKPSTNSYSFGWSSPKTMKRLSVSMWDNLCQIQINDTEASDGGYPKTIRDSGIKLSASQSTISSLLTIVEEVLDELKTGATTFESDSVFFGSGGNNAIQITDGSDIGKEPGLYIVLYKNVDENKTPEKMEIFQFNTGKATIKGYKPGEKASGKIHKRYRQELKEFKVALEEYERAATNMQAHFNRVANTLTVTKSLALISAIAATNGISAGEALGGSTDGFTNSGAPAAAGADNFKFSHGDYSDAYN